ncbi:hypothetical protein K0M31_009552 [Melipona bicolor]|uniref:Uncharacterized protein n=1 Tax=Melipona bicolor TaxID=60889 RepID=A0AA40KJ58_9HYME|nr:hypothetical protein K0M31_009552 [Melipona bicolor]
MERNYKATLALTALPFDRATPRGVAGYRWQKVKRGKKFSDIFVTKSVLPRREVFETLFANRCTLYCYLMAACLKGCWQPPPGRVRLCHERGKLNQGDRGVAKTGLLKYKRSLDGTGELQLVSNIVLATNGGDSRLSGEAEITRLARVQAFPCRPSLSSPVTGNTVLVTIRRIIRSFIRARLVALGRKLDEEQSALKRVKTDARDKCSKKIGSLLRYYVTLLLDSSWITFVREPAVECLKIDDEARMANAPEIRAIETIREVSLRRGRVTR